MFLHPSDELYGADRILIQVLDVAKDSDVRVVLPRDLVYPEHLLSQVLERRGVGVRHEHLPVLRRASARLKNAPRLLRDVCWLVWLLARERPSVVYLNTSAMLLAAWPARCLGSRVILHLHEVWRPGLERVALAFLARPCVRIVCVSKAVRQALPRTLRGKCQVIYNGIPRPAGTSLARQRSDGLAFLVASRWNAWKGHSVLLRAWQSVLDQGANGRTLTILGSPPATGEACPVEALVERLSDPSSVRIIGQVEDVRPYIEQSDCVVIPSLLPDPLPTIAIEAAASGRCVIASATGGLPEIVIDGKTGLLVPPGDADALAHAMSVLDKRKSLEMGSGALENYESMFSLTRFRIEIGDLLSSVRDRG